MNVLEAYKLAALELYGEKYGVTAKDVNAAFVFSENDPGEWSPGSELIIYTENVFSDIFGYYAPKGLDECVYLADRAASILGSDAGYLEWINAAVIGVTK